MRSGKQLEQRAAEVLASVVRRYISNGRPVGSKIVAERLPDGCSSATVRSVMAELEAQGFLAQPHISAGRVPTDKAYRFFVDRLAGSTRLAAATEKYIDERLAGEPPEPEELMARASRVLSEASHGLGLVLGPGREEKLLEHIKFVKLADRRVLVVIVSRPELIENKVLHLDEDFSQEELDRTASFLNSDFHGWSLRTIRLDIFKRIEEEKAICDGLLRNVATLFMWGAAAEESPGPLYVDDASKILDRPGFEDRRKIRELLSALEEKAKLVRILSACLESPSHGVQILIGRENPERRMQQCAIIAAPIRYRHRAVGAVGVVGPIRMEYERAITTVDYVAHLTSRLLSIN